MMRWFDLYRRTSRRAILAAIARIDIQVIDINRRLTKMALNLTALAAAVDRQTTVDASIEALCASLSQQLKDLASQSGDLTALQGQINAFADRLTTNSQAVAVSVAANTPAAPGTTGG